MSIKDWYPNDSQRQIGLNFSSRPSIFAFCISGCQTTLESLCDGARIEGIKKGLLDLPRISLTGGLQLSERWVQSSKKILERIKSLEEAEEKDRLELVRSTWFLLGALQRSLVGWLQWVKNPEIMVKFTQDELKEINDNMSKFVRSFIEYDMKVTKQGTKKGLKAKKKKTKEKAETKYVI